MLTRPAMKFAAGIALLSAAWMGCDQLSPKLSVKLELVAPCDQPEALQGVGTMQIITVSAGGDFKATQASRSAGSASIEGVSIDEGTAIYVNGFAGDVSTDGASVLSAFPVSTGASVPLNLKAFLDSKKGLAAREYPEEKDARVVVPVGIVNSFTSTCDATVPSSASPSQLNQGRHGHTATYLPTLGKVLILGGLVWSSDSPQEQGWVPKDRTAELYDPNTGTFVTADIDARFQPLIQRAYHTATAFSDGKVLVWGGIGPEGDGTQVSMRAVSFVLDPSASGDAQVALISDADGYSTRRFHHQATLTDSGLAVVITGGCGCTGTGVGGIFTVEEVKAGACPPQGATATDCYGNQARPAPVDVFDVPEMRAIPGTSVALASPRAFHSAIPVSPEQVVVMGGDDGNAPVQTIELVRRLPSVSVTQASGNLGTAAVTHAAAVRLSDADCATLDETHPRNNECILVTGGCQRPLTAGLCAEDDIQTTSTLFDLGKGTASEGPGAYRGRYGHQAFTLLQGEAMVLVLGGYAVVESGENPITAEILRRPETPSGLLPFVGVAKSMKSGRAKFGTAQMPSGQLLISGGEPSWSGTRQSLASAELFIFPFRLNP
jgi:hypothetical protein